MKEQRQKAILKLIQEEDLEVQEELLERLHKLGFAPCGVIRLANGSPRLAFQRRCGAPFACPAPGVL